VCQRQFWRSAIAVFSLQVRAGGRFAVMLLGFHERPPERCHFQVQAPSLSVTPDRDILRCQRTTGRFTRSNPFPLDVPCPCRGKIELVESPLKAFLCSGWAHSWPSLWSWGSCSFVRSGRPPLARAVDAHYNTCAAWNRTSRKSTGAMVLTGWNRDFMAEKAAQDALGIPFSEREAVY